MLTMRTDRVAIQRTAVRLVVAGTLALAAMVATQTWLDHSNAAAASGVAMADVLITARAIEPGERLVVTDMRWRPWPASAIDAGWLVRGRPGANGIIGRVATARLAAGTPLNLAMAAAPGHGSTFAAMIRPGQRAITIAVTSAAGLAGFLAPGDRVDVLLTQAIGNRRTGQTLLHDIMVLGVDQQQRGDGAGMTAPLEAAGDVIAEATEASGSEPPGLVTLEVSPKAAETLAVAAELGTLSLVLRGPGAEADGPGGRSWDTEITGLPAAMLAAGGNTASSAALPPVAPIPSPAAAAPAPRGVEITYGLPQSPATPPALATPEDAK